MRPGSSPHRPGPLEEHNFFRQRIFSRVHLPRRLPLRRWTWVKVWALGSMVGVTIALAQVQANADRDNQATLDGAYRSCLTGNEVRLAMQDVVRQAYARGGTLDFTAVPGFGDLSAAQQAYFRNIESLIAMAPDPEDDPNSRLNLSLALLALRDCDGEFPTHTDGIKLPPRSTLPSP